MSSHTGLFSAREREVVALAAIGSSIDDMVNQSLLGFSGVEDSEEVRFHTRPHQQLFSVLLADFLEPISSLLVGQQDTSIEILKSICHYPQFNEGHTIEFLHEPTSTLDEWLRTEIVVDAWLPSLNRQVALKIVRSEFVVICGTVSKHNLGRLTRTARRLAEILKKHGLEVPELDALRTLDDFYDRFHDDVLNYHASVLAEMLNNIRWGMWDYLHPTFLKAFSQRPGELEYAYRYPEGVEHEFSRSCFWDVMNDVRRKPFVARFHANDILRLRY
jgi:hypothetical protein